MERLVVCAAVLSTCRHLAKFFGAGLRCTFAHFFAFVKRLLAIHSDEYVIFVWRLYSFSLMEMLFNCCLALLFTVLFDIAGLLALMMCKVSLEFVEIQS